MVSPSSAFVSPRNGRSKRERRGGEGPGTVAVTLFVAGPESAEKTPLPRGFRENNSLVATRLSSQSFELYKFCFRFTSNFSKRKTKALGILIISHCCAHKPPRKNNTKQLVLFKETRATHECVAILIHIALFRVSNSVSETYP